MRIDPSDGSERMFGVSYDVTERKLAEERLIEADRRKDEFLAMLAHELRNPLAPLTYAHRLIGLTDGLPAQATDALGIAERQAAQLRRLVDDLLEVARISRGRIELHPEPVDLRAAALAALDAIAPDVQARRQRLEPRLPAAPLGIVADPARIGQVLHNLLHNASKYTPEGGRIGLELDADGRDAEIRVRDDGVGIEPAQLAAVFELFTQVDATLDRSQGGLGIGLALVKRLVEIHGGRVFAHSDGRGRGATFTVRLPLAPDAAGTAAPR
jgi:signal transduction histidine kinase